MSTLTQEFNTASETPLMAAAKTGNADLLRYLLEAQPDPFAYLDNQADGFKADPPAELPFEGASPDDQADGFKGNAVETGKDIKTVKRLKIKL